MKFLSEEWCRLISCLWRLEGSQSASGASRPPEIEPFLLLELFDTIGLWLSQSAPDVDLKL